MSMVEEIVVTFLDAPAEYIVVDIDDDGDASIITDEGIDTIEILSDAPIGPRGPSGVTGSAIISGSPVETPDGSRTLFSTPSIYATGTLNVFLNGLHEINFTPTTSTTFTFGTAPISEDVISLLYQQG